MFVVLLPQISKRQSFQEYKCIKNTQCILFISPDKKFSDTDKSNSIIYCSEQLVFGFFLMGTKLIYLISFLLIIMHMFRILPLNNFHIAHTNCNLTACLTKHNCSLAGNLIYKWHHNENYAGQFFGSFASGLILKWLIKDQDLHTS